MIKREIIITISTVLLVTTVFLMFSYAIFKVDETGEQNSISFGDIAMSFCIDENCDELAENVGNVIGTKKNENGETTYVPIYPQKDPSTEEEWNLLSPYTFTLKNTGNLDLYVTIFLNRDTTSGLSYTTTNSQGETTTYTEPVADDQIKIAIGEQGLTPTKMLYSETEVDPTSGNIIAEVEIKAGDTKTFNLYAWLREDAENASQGKYFVTLISARGEFIPND